MLKHWLALVLSLAGANLALAQPITNPAPVGDAGAYNSSAPTCTNGQFCFLQTDVNGNLKTVGSGTPTGTQDVEILPGTASKLATAYVATAALASNKVLKAAAGNLYSFQVSADSTLAAAAWWVMVHDAISLPGDGAITPAKCFALPAGSTSMSANFTTPVRLATGITIGVSTNGCFTQAASVHAFISGEAQ